MLKIAFIQIRKYKKRHEFVNYHFFYTGRQFHKRSHIKIQHLLAIQDRFLYIHITSSRIFKGIYLIFYIYSLMLSIGAK